MDSQGGTGSQGGMDQLDLLEKMDKMEPLDNLELLEPLDPKDPLVGGSPTPGGGRVLAHKLEALSYSTLASLEEPIIPTKEVEPITCVCREAQSSHQNTAPTSHTKMGCRDIHMCMGQSISFLCKAHTTTMCLVLCAMCPLDPL